MVDVTSFLTRWLYLSNLVRDVADIQTLPYTPMHQQATTITHHPPQQHPLPPPPMAQQTSSSTHVQQSSVRPTEPTTASHTATNTDNPLHRHHVEQEWKDHCLRGILSYPPGTQRLYVMDALRLELVQRLAQRLRISDETLERFASICKRQAEIQRREEDDDEEDDLDPYMDADVEIVRAFQEAAASNSDGDESGGEQNHEDNDSEQHHHSSHAPHEDAVLVISKNGTDVMKNGDSDNNDVVDEEIPSFEQVEEAHRIAVDFREYLPQLVSAVLKSPPAFQRDLIDPINKLRRLILTRCLQDPNWGIELCWLLEADVGRAWKTLFEHRQQTGKRLIVVLPAEKAAVIAKIGTEKREAFDLLQDAEQATAYGYTIPIGNHHHHPHHPHYYQHDGSRAEDFDADVEPTPPRLPSSLSLRRCSHFGDTMHFIDKLTQISMDLRRVPDLQREVWLNDCLCEMNRRLRRRMVTKGDVSLDVEDNRGPHDWPQLSDVSADMLQYSVHFPLVSKRITWPNGEGKGSVGSVTEKAKGGVLRVLNIVTSESRILSSRERCPFLVHLEVAETGLEGNDARLYASGARGLGATLTESLGVGPNTRDSDGQSQRDQQHHQKAGSSSYGIPSELFRGSEGGERSVDDVLAQGNDPMTIVGSINLGSNPQSGDVRLMRGGDQSDESLFYPPDGAEYIYSNPYDMVRQQEYEQLHQELRPHPGFQSSPLLSQRHPVSTGEALLEKVFGLPWDEKCAQIRQTSPFGKVKGWRLASFIMKAGEDIRREALVMQIISKMNEWFQTDIPESHRPHLRPYTIMCVGGDAGLIECLSDAKSIDEVKKRADGFVSLRDYFERAYGPPKASQRPHLYNPSSPPEQQHGPVSFEQAQDNFLRSLVGYSLVCYVLQIKDRHNANILLDREGHIVHIDFGFVLGDTPKMGKVPLFSERAPFKLSTEFWEVLGGWNFHEGGLGVRFCKMFERAFESAAARVDEIVSLTEAAMLNLSRNPDNARALAGGIRSRLRMRGPPGSVEQKTFIMDLVNTALTSWGTSTYDWLQRNMNGYQ